MKKAFSYLLIGALMAGVNASLVKADNSATLTESGDTSAEVTVGDVEVPVYSVDIRWDNFVFDWKYDNELDGYNWKVHKSKYCAPIEYENAYYNTDTIYSNGTCTDEIQDTTGYQASDTVYYLTEPDEDAVATLSIGDYSTGGRIVPTLTWTPESTYNFTTASFKYIKDEATCVAVPQENINVDDELFTDSNCSGEAVLVSNAPQGTNFYEWHIEEVKTPFQGGELPLEASSDAPGAGALAYNLQMELGVDTTKTVTTPVAGETIGTLTISIETH